MLDDMSPRERDYFDAVNPLYGKVESIRSRVTSYKPTGEGLQFEVYDEVEIGDDHAKRRGFIISYQHKRILKMMEEKGWIWGCRIGTMQTIADDKMRGSILTHNPDSATPCSDHES